MSSPDQFPQFNFGVRPCSAPQRGMVSFEDASAYCESVVYRDGWSFLANDHQVGALYQLAADPVDRRVHIWIRRVRELTFPTTIAYVNDLVLALITEIEDHERLEWLRQYQPDNPVPQQIFPAHCIDEPYNGPQGFSEGKRVYDAHARRLKRTAR